jgi:hypothetical protein
MSRSVNDMSRNFKVTSRNFKVISRNFKVISRNLKVISRSKGNLTGITDPMGHITADTYTSLNQLSSSIDPANNTITYAYNNVV